MSGENWLQIVETGRTPVKWLRRQRLGGGSTQTLHGGRKSERALGVGSVPDAGVVLLWSLGQHGGRNLLAFVDFVEHPQADLSSLMFQTCPFQIFKHRCYTAW